VAIETQVGNAFLEPSVQGFGIEVPNLMLEPSVQGFGIEVPNLIIEVSVAVAPPPPVLALPSGLWQSDVIYDQNFSTFVENGVQLVWVYEPVLLPDNGAMAENLIVEADLAMAFIGAAPVVTVTVQDAAGNQLDQIVATPPSAETDWNEFNWNQAPWNGTISPIAPFRLDWHQPLVFKQAFFSATGVSAQGFKIANLYMKYQILGYRQQTQVGSS
jgi:hypothetical protein